ncbi:MAG: biopolymer transporter ExbD [Firmicutes bacterium]|jgi:biopolymer transport protein ExbD|nr:biopolymer transporter ExbD [Bacillota bacterium]NLO65929.1 biopolymer transporter ExbD [Bacillota bacterium]
MNFRRTKQFNRGPDIVSMIDVVFFLLVFFMVFFTLRTTPVGLDVELPKAVSGSAQNTTNIEVLVDKSGVFYVAGKPVSGNELSSYVGDRLKVNPDLFVIVKADKAARYEHVVEALDHIRGVGGYRLGLAVQKD